MAVKLVALYVQNTRGRGQALKPARLGPVGARKYYPSYHCSRLWSIFSVQYWYIVFAGAMRCISAAYAVMRCLSVCLSVCVSVTFVSCVKANKDIFEIFSPSCSQAIIETRFN